MTAEREKEWDAFWEKAMDVAGVIAKHKGIFNGVDLERDVPADVRLRLVASGIDDEGFCEALDVMRNDGKNPDLSPGFPA